MRRLARRLTVALVECLVFVALVIGPFVLRLLFTDRF